MIKEIAKIKIVKLANLLKIIGIYSLATILPFSTPNQLAKIAIIPSSSHRLLQKRNKRQKNRKIIAGSKIHLSIILRIIVLSKYRETFSVRLSLIYSFSPTKKSKSKTIFVSVLKYSILETIPITPISFKLSITSCSSKLQQRKTWKHSNSSNTNNSIAVSQRTTTTKTKLRINSEHILSNMMNR
jgi:hypothetical protein